MRSCLWLPQVERRDANGGHGVAKGVPKDAKGSQEGAKESPIRPQRGPKGTQRDTKNIPNGGLGRPGETLGRPGATIPKTSAGAQFFRLKNGPDFGGPGVDFSTIFASNFRNDFSLIFDAVFVAKLPSKSRPKGGQGREMPGQSLP